MSRCKDYTKYPPEFFDILMEVETRITRDGAENAKDIVMLFNNAHDADKFRLEFYSYKAAVERDETAIEQLFPHCQFLVVRRAEGTDNMLIGLRENQSHIKAIRKQLEAMKNEDV